MKHGRHLKLIVLGLFALSVASNLRAQNQAVEVMSFNIRYGTADDGSNSWQHRRGLVMDVIRDAAPDILGVQEALAFQIQELEQSFPAYSRVGVGRDDGESEGEFAAIFYDSERFELLNSGHFWFSETPAVPGSMDWGNRITRMSTWVHLHDMRTHNVFYVYNLHWDHESQESRLRSAQLLVERIEARRGQRDPVIVMGDFNAGEDNPAFRYLTDHGLSDTFRLRHPDALEVGTFNSFRGVSDGEKIDAVLVSSGWLVSGAEIVRHASGGRYPSDHFPVTAVLSAAPR